MLFTTAFPHTRVIAVLRSDEKSVRYALHRFPDGSVSWRADTFTAPEHPADPERWVDYGGELSVVDVIARAPEQRRSVLDWTRAEVSAGLEVDGVDDPVTRERRARSLERLRGELDAAATARPGRAA